MATQRSTLRTPSQAAKGTDRTVARRSPKPPAFHLWMAQQVFNLDDARREAAIAIQSRWGFESGYDHARTIRVLSRENSAHAVAAKQLADDYAAQFELNGAALMAVSGVAGKWFPSAVEFCTRVEGVNRACTREAIPGTGLCARHGGQWMTEADREDLSHEIYDRLAGLTTKAVRVIEDILDHGRSEKVRLDAAIAVLDRTGMGPSQTLRVEVGDTDPASVIAERLERLAIAADQVAHPDTADEIVIEDAEVVDG